MADIHLLFDVLGGGTLAGKSGELINQQLTQIVEAINATPFGIKFEADKESINKFKSDIDTLVKSLARIGGENSASAISGITNAISSLSDRQTQGLDSVVSKLSDIVSLTTQLNDKSFNITQHLSPGRNDIANIELYREKAYALLEIAEQIRQLPDSFVSKSLRGDDLSRYIAQFEKYDVDKLSSSIRNATTSSELKNTIKQLDAIYELFNKIAGAAKSAGIEPPKIDTSNLNKINEVLDRVRNNAQETQRAILELASAAGRNTNAQSQTQSAQQTSSMAANGAAEGVSAFAEKLNQEIPKISDVLNTIRTQIETTFDLATVDMHTSAVAEQLSNICASMSNIKVSLDLPSVNQVMQTASNGLPAISSELSNVRDTIGEVLRTTAGIDASKVEDIANALRANGVDSQFAAKIAEDFSRLEGTIDSIQVRWNEFGEDGEHVASVIVSSTDKAGNSFRNMANYIRDVDEEGKTVWDIQRSGVAKLQISAESSAERLRALKTAIQEYWAEVRKSVKDGDVSAPKDVMSDQWGASSQQNSERVRERIGLLNELQQKVRDLSNEENLSILTTKDRQAAVEMLNQLLRNYAVANEDAARSDLHRSEKAAELERIQSQASRTIGSAEAVLRKYARAANSSKEGSKEAFDDLKRALADLQEAFNQDPRNIERLRENLEKVKTVARTSTGVFIKNGEGVKTFSERLAEAAQRLSIYFSLSSLIMKGIRVVRQMISTSVELDSAFTQLKIVTHATDAEMAQFSETAANLAQNLGKSISDVAKSIEVFSRLGYNLKDAAELAEYATILSNVADVDSGKATTGLTSIIKGFNLNVEDASHVADVLVEVGQKYAVSASEMMEAYEKSGAALHATNTSLEKSAGLIAAANASVQNASTVGTALKTVSARIRGSKTDLEELGEDIEDLAQGFSKYAEEIKALTKFDIMADAEKGQFKDIYEIFEGISKVWDKLSDTQQARVAEILGGTRQLQVIASIINNWGDAANAYATAMDSAGAATQANDVYMQSAAAHIEQFKAAFQKLSSTVFESKLIKFFVDFGTAIIKLIDKVAVFINRLGGLKIVLGAIGAYMAVFKAEMITGAIIKTWHHLGDTIDIVKNSLKALKNIIPNAIAQWRSYDTATTTAAVATEGAAASTATASSVLQASIPVIGLAIAAFTALIAVLSSVSSKAQENRDAAIAAAKEAASASDEITSLTLRLTSLEDEYKSNINKSEEYIATKDNLITKLKEEGVFIDSLTSKYDKNTTSLRNMVAEELRQEELLLRSGYLSAQTNLMKVRNEEGKQSSTLSSISSDKIYIWAAGTGEEYEKNKKAWEILEKYADWDLIRYTDNNLETQVRATQEYALNLSNDANGLVEAYKKANELLKLLQEHGAANSNVYKELSKASSYYATSVGEYLSAIDSLNRNTISQSALDLLSGKELPKTVAEFHDYKQSIIDAVAENGAFIGSTDELSVAVDAFLAQQPQFEGFYKTISNVGAASNMAVQESTLRISKATKELSDDISALKSDYELLSKAQSEIDKDGGLSPDTIKELASANENYLDYLYEENGQIKLNTEAWKEQAELRMSNHLAELQASRDELATEKEILKVKIAQAEAFLVEHSDPHDQKQQYAEQTLAKLKDELAEVDTAILQNQSILGIYETVFEKITESASEALEGAHAYDHIVDSFSGVADKIKSVSDEFKTLAEMQQLVGKNFRLSQEEALKYAEIYPEILDSATVTANGELQLNETVVNDFIKGKRAELEASIQSKIDELNARKQVMTAIQAFAQEELRIATLVAEGEGKLDFDVNQLRLDNKNALVDALIKAGISEVDAQKMAAEAMAGNYTEVDKVAANASIDIATNLGKAANSAADSIHKNMHRSKQSVASLASQAGRTAHAIRNMMSGAQYAYDDLDDIVPDSGGGAGYSSITTSVYNGSFNGVSYTYTPQTAALHDFIAQLTQEIADYGAAINQLDGQIALLQALKDHAFDIFSHANANSGGSSGSGSGSGGGSGTSDPSWFETQYKLYQHLLAMDAAEQEDYINWLSWAYQEAFNQGIITLDEFFKYQEEVFNGMRNLFKDYLNDLEHQISMREHFNGETAAILELYQEMLAAVEEEIARAREQGLDDNDSYLQELQEQYWKYHDAIEDLQNSITENAQNAVDDLIQIRIKMLKDEIQREKDAINERLKLLRDFYSKQKEMLRDQYNEEKYLREQSDKRKKIEDILAELAQLEYDNSAWAQRRKLELQQQLAEAQAELDEFEHDHALEMAEDELDHLQEMQEEELNNQLDALEEHENDAQALYQQALEDIKNGSIELYEEMIEWNQLYGDGIEDTIKDAWEAAYQALQDYMDLYGEYYQGIHLGNATGYDPGGTWDDHPIHVPPSGSGQTSSDAPTPPSASEPSSPSTPAMFPYGKASDTTGTIKKGSRGDQVKAIQYALNMLGFGNSGTQSVDGIFGTNTEKAVKAFQRQMGLTADGIVGNRTRHKFAAEGYRSGTKYATPGLHPFEEDKLTETVFESKDGSRYKMFTGGEKVLNAKASDFLYKFAMSGGSVLEHLVQSMFGHDRPGITPPIKRVEINMGDIIVQGSADHNTVSEIRRAQRESITRIIKEFNKLSTI